MAILTEKNGLYQPIAANSGTRGRAALEFDSSANNPVENRIIGTDRNSAYSEQRIIGGAPVLGGRQTENRGFVEQPASPLTAANQAILARQPGEGRVPYDPISQESSPLSQNDIHRVRQQIRPLSEIARDKWEPRVEELMKIPLLNRGVTKEGIAVPLQHHLELNSAVMLIQVDPNSPGVPLEILQRLYGQEAINQALGIKCICITGHSMAGISHPGMSLAQNAHVTSLSFKSLQLPGAYGLKTIEMALDTDIRETPQYRWAREALASSNEFITPRAREEACLYLAAQEIWGCKVIGGWTSFPGRNEFANAKEGLVDPRSFARDCTLNAFGMLEELDRTLFALVAMKSGHSLLGSTRPAHPDLITPVTYYGSDPDGRVHGRIPLSSYDPAYLSRLMPDIFDQAPELRKMFVQYQSHVWGIFKLIEEVQPGRLPVLEREAADLRITSDMVKSWKAEVEYDPQNQSAQRMLMQAIYAAYNARTPIIMQYIQAVTNEVAPLYSSLSPRGTLERIDVPLVEEPSGAEPRSERSARRGTLNTQFRGGALSTSRPVLPVEKVLSAAEVGGNDSNGGSPPGDNDETESAFAE